MELSIGILIGIGLSAACGFRVFLPLLGTSLAALSGHLDLAPGFDWIGTPVAAACFGTATVLEVIGFYVPWLDNLLDTIATPAAVVAGTILTASMVVDISPFLKWTLAVIAGGGVAGTIKGGTVLLRGASSGTTGGAGNPILSTIELVSSAVMTVLSVVVPVVAAILAIGLLIVGFAMFRRLRRWLRNRGRNPEQAAEPAA
jgi:hypothetical protein